jgi:hypothetical protein
MRNMKATKVILTAYREGTPEHVNMASADNLFSDLTLVDSVVGFRAVEGRYNGNAEESIFCWLRPGDILDGIEELCALAREYSQDAILVIHGDDAAELVETHGTCSAIIGTFQAVDAPLPGEDFTKADSTYYVVR